MSEAVQRQCSVVYSKPADLGEEDYQQIAQAQKEGKSFRLVLELNDGTSYSLYVIPSLGIAMIGDGRYSLPEAFADDFGSLFDGFSQEPVPAQ